MGIRADGLTKVFKLPNREKGLKGALKHIVKPVYTQKTAVDHVSFSIEDGESVAYIGPNGAGKSTTIKMLTGILHATSGTMSIQGNDPFKNREANAKNIGVVFGQRTQLWWDIPIEESFRLLKDIYEVSDNRYEENMKLFCEVFGLKEFLSRSARRLSLGQRMRADLAAALIHDPKVLFLDEPTIGLDISVKENMRSFIKMINQERGTTIILTSHDLKDIEDLCERVIVIDEGKIICDAHLPDLVMLYAHERVIRVTLKRPEPLFDVRLSSDKMLKVTKEVPEGYVFSIAFDVNAYTAYEVIQIAGEAADIQDIQLMEPDIKEVISRIYRSELKVSQA